MTEIQGDLLKIKEGIIFHQVNCMGRTGGLAEVLRRTFPLAFTGYFRCCELQWDSILGTSVIGHHGAVRIVHVFGQMRPGPNTEIRKVDSALAEAKVRLFPWRTDTAMYFPYKMGCGLGGGNWDEYRAMIEKHFSDAIIVRKPGYD